MTGGAPLRIGSRKSALARTQAEWVSDRLPGCTAMVWVTSEGDQNRSQPLSSFGGVGVFTRALHDALREDRIDELVLTTVPVLLGGGIALFASLNDPLAWDLVSTEGLAGGLVRSRYRRRRG